MTSSFKICAARKIVAAALLAVTIFPIRPAGAVAQQSVMHRGDITIGAQEVVNDVVVADGNLVLSGRVKGSMFIVNGDVMINPGASVTGNLTVLAGSLWVSKGAGVAGEINIFSGEAHVEKGAEVGRQVRALKEVSSLTPEKLALISRYILFNRKVPKAGFQSALLNQMDLSALRLRRDRDREIYILGFYELGKTRLDPEAVRQSREVGFRGHDIRVKVCVIEFNSKEAADAFWEGLRDDYEEKTRYSVHNSLGDGAHWYFRHRGASYCLWYGENTFQAVMVRHDDNNPEADEWEHVEGLRDRIILELKNLYDLQGE